MRTRPLVVASLLLLLLLTPLSLILLLPGCPGDYEAPPADEVDASTTGTPYDPGGGGGGGGGSSSYPDFSAPSSQTDGWTVVPDTGYGGAPFGCVRDSDCFGLRCCATPWGVKLCQEVCPTQD